MTRKFKNNFTGEIINIINTDNKGTIISIETKSEIDVLTIDIHNLEIPQYPVVDINKIERIRIKIKDGVLPEVFCRNDFPIVPHLNLLSDGQRTMCLFDVSFNEIKHMFNASVLINRIIYWFEKTARGELHQIDQPLEPYFPYVKNLLFLK